MIGLQDGAKLIITMTICPESNDGFYLSAILTQQSRCSACTVGLTEARTFDTHGF